MTIRRLAASPVRAWCRSSISSRADGGNFGADPKPACSGSKVRATFSTAVPSSSSVSLAGEAPERSAIAAIWRAMSAPEAATSSRRVRQAFVTATRSCRNDPIPGRDTGGKYVPAKNGSPAGVRNTVIGQPPWPVRATVTSM